jgi:CBS domain containing-hemolysin-like protein
MSGSDSKSEGDSSRQFWAAVKLRLFGIGSEPTLREQIEEVIDDAEDEPGDASRDGRGHDMSQLERDMLRNMLAFGETTVDDVAVPRADIIAIDETADITDVIDLFAEADHSRLPIFRERLDDVVGMVHVKDLFGPMARGTMPSGRLCDHPTLIRQPLYVPQSMPAMELLAEMRQQRVHLAIVLDEYGGTDGLVTIEDLVEEIVGDIEDEHDDAPTALLTEIEDGVWEADARIELDDLADALDPRLADVDEDVDTLGGLSFVLAGHVPQMGESVAHPSGWRIEVVDGDDRRVLRARLFRPELPTGEI